MSVYCPILKRDVVYLECLECDDKKCKDLQYQKPEEKTTKEEK